MQIRLQKYLADCGIASRRKSEELILAGKVKVNDEIITQLGVKIDPQTDKIYYQNKLVQPANYVYIMLNKPQGYTCTTRKFLKEKNILDLVNVKEKVFPVGRLDKNTQGLIFLTNDGNFAYRLTHPKFQIEKEYVVMLREPPAYADASTGRQHDIVKNLEIMEQGIMDENELLKIQSYRINSPNSTNIILTQGHKREIRRLFAHFNYQIKDLKRIRIDKWQLGNLAEGKWQYFQP
jgi:23S rRNA pseudouridine2605 synthase